MIDRKTYRAWHTSLPMSRFLEHADPDGFLVEGRGVRVRDAIGRWYLDARSSLFNVTLGYSNSRVVEAIEAQLRQLPFATTIRDERPSVLLPRYADEVVARIPERLTRVRVGTTGSQMVEAAVLLSRIVRQALGERSRTSIIALEGHYHGSGAAAGALSASPPMLAAGPLLGDVHHVRSFDCAAIEVKVSELGAERVTAVICEPASTGVLAPPGDFFPRLERLCLDTGIHLIVDEVTTGWGRVGAMTRCGQVGIAPDMIVLGKGLAAGYAPLAALAVTEDVYDALYEAENGTQFMHGSTSDGSPVALAAGLAVIEALEEDGILAGVERREAWLRAALEPLVERHEPVRSLRGVGLLYALELAAGDGDSWSADPLELLQRECERRGLLVLAAPSARASHHVFVAPPLIIDEDECEEIGSVLDAALAELFARV